MSKKVPVMARVSPETKARLQSLAKTAKRSEAYLAEEAIENFVDLNEWQIRLIQERLGEASTGGPGIPHEEVERWLDAKGTGHELPIPKAPRRKS